MIRLSSLALRRSLHAALTQDTALKLLLGDERVHDDVPRGAPLPYVSFGETRWRDWSSAGDRGGEEFFTLDVWSDHAGSRQALDIAERVAQSLETSDLRPEGMRLVSLRFEALDVRHDGTRRLTRASLRFRAVTETI